MKALTLITLIILLFDSQVKPNCENKNLKIKFLADIESLTSNGYKCDTLFNYNKILKIKDYKVLFSDSNY